MILQVLPNITLKTIYKNFNVSKFFSIKLFKFKPHNFRFIKLSFILYPLTTYNLLEK